MDTVKENLANKIAITLADQHSLSVSLGEVVRIIQNELNNYSIAKMETTLPSTGDGSATRYMLQKFAELKLAKGMKPKTIARYLDAVQLLCDYTHKEAHLCSADDIIKFLDFYRYHGRQNKPVCDNTVKTVFRLNSSFFTFCYKYHYIDDNPIEKVEVPKASAKVKKPLTTREKIKIVMALEKIPGELGARDMAIVMFMLDSGIRVEELVNLDIGDVDLLNKVCHIRCGKGKKARTVIFTDSSAVRIEQYLGYRMDNGTLSNGEPLFTSVKLKHNRLTTDAVRYRMTEIGKLSGVVRIHPHLLRCTFATDCVKHGIPLNVIQDQLGHESLETTSIYTKIDIDTRKNLIQR